MTTLLIDGWQGGALSLSLPLPLHSSPLSFIQLSAAVAERTQLSPEQFYLTHNGRILHPHSSIPSSSSPASPSSLCSPFSSPLSSSATTDSSVLLLRLLPRNCLLGGKGGFGSLLRGATTKVGAKKTTNFSASRDLSGRRMRHVEAERQLQQWQQQEHAPVNQAELSDKYKRIKENRPLEDQQCKWGLQCKGRADGSCRKSHPKDPAAVAEEEERRRRENFRLVDEEPLSPMQEVEEEEMMDAVAAGMSSRSKKRARSEESKEEENESDSEGDVRMRNRRGRGAAAAAAAAATEDGDSDLHSDSDNSVSERKSNSKRKSNKRARREYTHESSSSAAAAASRSPHLSSASPAAAAATRSPARSFSSSSAAAATADAAHDFILTTPSHNLFSRPLPSSSSSSSSSAAAHYPSLTHRPPDADALLQPQAQMGVAAALAKIKEKQSHAQSQSTHTNAAHQSTASSSAAESKTSSSSPAAATTPAAAADTFAPIDLSLYSSSTDLLTFSPAHLSHELTRCGLKAGGTHEQRAERLFMLKGKTIDQLPKKVRAQ